MSYTILFFDEVKQDIKEAKSWYRKQLKGLEKRFAEDIKTTIIHIGERPYTHAIPIKIFVLHIRMFFRILFTTT